ncbi:MAG: SpoIIE family protein phosphatase [Caldithrix sp.]|nr:SpoIIE family protein phosphatase [Caldithrix sp.]
MQGKILVVDDEPDFAYLIEQRFRKHIRNNEYHFSFAQDGMEALDLLDKNKDVDIVLTDINMPKMNGLTLLEKINERYPHLKSVIITAYGDMKNIRTAFNRGAFDFITKPIDFEDLTITINKTIRQARELKEAVSNRNQLVAINRELDIARNIQQNMLPRSFPPFPDRKEFDIYAEMKPAKEVGGDLYDFFLIDDSRLGFCIGDVSGKGVPAALFMAMTKTLLKSTGMLGLSAGDVLKKVNRPLHIESTSSMYVTLCYGVIDLKTGELSFSHGGHNAFYLVKQSGDIRSVQNNGGIPVSFLPHFDYPTSKIQLDDGDLILFYTDGVSEAMDTKENEFGEENIETCLKSLERITPQDTIQQIMQTIDTHTAGAEQFDDITMLAIQYHPAQ